MLLACWSPKGGSGTTVVAASLSLAVARTGTDVLLADLAGDAAAVLGASIADGPGLNGWLAAADDVGPDAIARLEVEVAPHLTVLATGAPTGDGTAPPARTSALAGALAADGRVVIVDCGTVAHPRPVAHEVVAAADVSLVVLRPCYLALRRATSAALRATAAVVVVEPDRSLRGRDVEQVLGVPVVAEVPLRSDVARRVDAGLLTSSLPVAYARRLAAVARHAGVAA